MRTEKEINDMINEIKDSLVNSSGDQTLLLQGFIRALNWVVLEEEEEKN